MCTMSIHADDAFALALRAYAKKVGKGINRTVQDLLSGRHLKSLSLIRTAS